MRTSWWGDRGPAPHERWPGVTIDIPAKWSVRNGRWESGDYYFDERAADKACAFFPEFLRHHIGEFAGRPFTLMEYQSMLLTRPIFGWKHKRTGMRRFRKVFAFVPKGGGKSPWGAGTGLYMTACDGEEGAEVYAVAADKDQAKIVHDNSKIMVEESPDLREDLVVYRDAIVHEKSHSTYKVISSDASTKHGFRPHCVIFDELHAQKNRDLFEALRKSMAKRRQPLMIIITHAGSEDEGICMEEYEYAKNVLGGTVDDPTMLPVIFEIRDAPPHEEDWTDPRVWRRVNPGHGVTVQHDAIMTECREAIAEPRKRNDFLRFHLNKWTNQAVAWLPVEWLDRCTRQLPPAVELAELACAGGLDGAQKWDLVSFVVAFREQLKAGDELLEVVDENAQKKIVSLNYKLHLLPTFWMPEDTLIEHEHDDHIPYSKWRDAGWLRVTEGRVIDYDKIQRDILAIAARFPRLKSANIGYDPAFMTDTALRLAASGLKPVETLQNYKYMSEPCFIFEALLKAGRVAYDGNRCFRWNTECVAIKRDDVGRVRPIKPRTSKRIDGVVAAVMALRELSVVSGTPAASVYEDRGVLVL